MLYHGWSDAQVTPFLIDFFQKVVRVAGAGVGRVGQYVARSFRHGRCYLGVVRTVIIDRIGPSIEEKKKKVSQLGNARYVTLARDRRPWIARARSVWPFCRQARKNESANFCRWR